VTDLIQLGVALAKRGREVELLRGRILTIDNQLGNVFGMGSQPSAYLIQLQETLRVERERYESEIEILRALSDDDLRKLYTPVPAQPATQPAGFDPALNAILSSGAKAPAGYVPGQEYRGTLPSS
jgi:hypothetical protein